MSRLLDYLRVEKNRKLHLERAGLLGLCLHFQVYRFFRCSEFSVFDQNGETLEQSILLLQKESGQRPIDFSIV